VDDGTEVEISVTDVDVRATLLPCLMSDPVLSITGNIQCALKTYNLFNLLQKYKWDIFLHKMVELIKTACIEVLSVRQRIVNFTSSVLTVHGASNYRASCIVHACICSGLNWNCGQVASVHVDL